VGLPQGPKGTLPTTVKTVGDSSTLQTRFVFFHPNKAVIECDQPKRYRWGKPPRTYRGLRKIWVAQDMATKDRTSIAPAKMVKTPVPSLGLDGAPAEAEKKDGGGDAGAGAADGEKDDCDCRTAGGPAPLGHSAWLVAVVALGAAARRRRRSGEA
jgi:MYXO-CTERM domain-containing protein